MIDNPGHATIHIPTETRGTGGHTHHRSAIEHDGLRVGFWRCEKGTPDAPWCPSEPDPWILMQRKVAERRAKRADRPSEPAPLCAKHPVERQRTYGKRRVCLVCQSDRDRTRAIARRIERGALKVA
jgi:hypothetical protein